MPDSYFSLVDETPDLSRFVASEHTVGPWSSHLQHGGPPSSLAVAVADRFVRKLSGRDDLSPCRLAGDFVGAVPVAELSVGARLVRKARSAALVETTISSGERDCYVARVWFVRDTDTAGIAAMPEMTGPIPESSGGMDFMFGYGESLDWRFVSGGLNTPGPGAAWARPWLPLVSGWDYTGLGRAALIADSGSGVSSALDWKTWSFVNVDLDVHLARPVVGEWILLDAETHLGPNGSALARSTLSDERGVVGGGLQTLVLTAIPTD